MSVRVLRREQVKDKTGLAKSAIYKLMKDGDFPRPIQLTAGGAVGWIESEIEAWIVKRMDAPRAGHQMAHAMGDAA